MSYAVVLSGGGAKGAFQVGVLKQLEEKFGVPETIYGTSIGAVNAAIYSAAGAQGLEEAWRDIRQKSDVMRRNKYFFFSAGFRAYGINSMWPMKQRVRKYLEKTENVCLAKVCRTSLKTGKIDYVDSLNPDFLDATIGSASIPVIFNRQGEWVDGGVKEMTPLAKPIQDGFTEIKVILTGRLYSSYIYTPSKNLYKDGLRALNLCKHEMLVNDLKFCLKLNDHPAYQKIKLSVYEPVGLGMGTLDINSKKIANAIELGYATEPLSPNSYKDLRG